MKRGEIVEASVALARDDEEIRQPNDSGVREETRFENCAVVDVSARDVEIANRMDQEIPAFLIIE